jgi:hypothetical protein
VFLCVYVCACGRGMTKRSRDTTVDKCATGVAGVRIGKGKKPPLLSSTIVASACLAAVQVLVWSRAYLRLVAVGTEENILQDDDIFTNRFSLRKGTTRACQRFTAHTLQHPHFHRLADARIGRLHFEQLYLSFSSFFVAAVSVSVATRFTFCFCFFFCFLIPPFAILSALRIRAAVVYATSR